MNYSISFKTIQKYCKHKFERETLSKESFREGQGKYGCMRLVLDETDLTTDEIYKHPKFPLSPSYDPKLTACNESNCLITRRLDKCILLTEAWKSGD